MWRTQIENHLFFPEFDLGINSDLSKRLYLGKAPPLRAERKGGSGRGEKEGRGGREGVGPRRRGSAAAWVRGGVGNFEGSQHLPILTDGDAEWLYRLPLAGPTKYQKFSR